MSICALVHMSGKVLYEEPHSLVHYAVCFLLNCTKNQCLLYNGGSYIPEHH